MGENRAISQSLPPPQAPPLIVYEYPLSERIRTLLRLEDLFERARHFLAGENPLEHHVALLSLFLDGLESPGGFLVCKRLGKHVSRLRSDCKAG